MPIFLVLSLFFSLNFNCTTIIAALSWKTKDFRWTIRLKMKMFRDECVCVSLHSFIRFALLIFIYWWNTKWGMLKCFVQNILSIDILWNLHNVVFHHIQVNSQRCITKCKHNARAQTFCRKIPTVPLFSCLKKTKTANIFLSQSHWQAKTMNAYLLFLSFWLLSLVLLQLALLYFSFSLLYWLRWIFCVFIHVIE